jgi:NAD(P)-dependent dehydrogenase (short-subunit alcohol dehydrogenase family)
LSGECVNVKETASTAVHRVAVVIGSDSGIGRATAVALGNLGFDLGITWHTDHDGARETAVEIGRAGGRAQVRQLDLADAAAAAAVTCELGDALGGLDVLVNSGAVNPRAPVVEQSVGEWRRTLDINLTGPFACAQAAARRMLKHGTPGRIINITSVHEHVPLRNGAAYSVAKAGLGMFTKVLALELAASGITVNSVAPGHVATPMNGYRGANPDLVPRPGIPIGRIAHPREVAAAVAHLASASAAYTTGHSYVVDGGLSLMAAVPLQSAVEGLGRSGLTPNEI